jgi:hypothetical protein
MLPACPLSPAQWLLFLWSWDGCGWVYAYSTHPSFLRLASAETLATTVRLPCVWHLDFASDLLPWPPCCLSGADL